MVFAEAGVSKLLRPSTTATNPPGRALLKANEVPVKSVYFSTTAVARYPFSAASSPTFPTPRVEKIRVLTTRVQVHTRT